MLKELQRTEKGLGELSRTIEYAKNHQGDPKLKHLTQDEMQLRAKFIRKCRKRIKEIRLGMTETGNMIDRQNKNVIYSFYNI